MSAAPALAPRLPTSTMLSAAQAGNARIAVSHEEVERVLVSNDFVLGRRDDCPGEARAWCEVCPLVDLCEIRKGQLRAELG